MNDSFRLEFSGRSFIYFADLRKCSENLFLRTAESFDVFLPSLLVFPGDLSFSFFSLSLGKLTLLESLAERESIYRILAQTTPENTSKDFAAYTVDPHTRYPTLNKRLVLPFQVTHLVDTDNAAALEEELNNSNSNSNGHNDTNNSSKKRRRKESHVSAETLLGWFQKQLSPYDCIAVNDMTFSFQNGLALCAIIHRYRPDLVEFEALDPAAWAENCQLAFDLLEAEFGLPPAMTGSELATSRNPDKLAVTAYLTQIYELFRKDIPVLPKLARLDVSEEDLLEKQRYSKTGRKKRRSKDPDEAGATAEECPNKENIQETLRLNRSATKKRMQKLMERAEDSKSSRKSTGDKLIKSIKKEERYKIIEEQFVGKKRQQAVDMEDKKPKDLKRAIGKLDKDDWNIRNIEDKMVVQQKPDSGKLSS